MWSQLPSKQRSRMKKKLHVWFLGFLVLAFAGMILCGPKLYHAQAQHSPAVVAQQPGEEPMAQPPLEEPTITE